MPKAIQQDKITEVINLYQEGLSTRDVSGKTGVSQTQIRRILNKNGIQQRSVKTPPELEKKICEDYNAGESSNLLAKKFNMHDSSIRRIVMRNGFKLRSLKENNAKFNINTRFFEKIDTEEKAYFLGFLFADGNVDKRERNFKISLHKKDLHILKTFQSMLFNNNDNHIKDYDGYPVLMVSRKDIVLDLIKHGCTPNKTFKLKFPYNSLREELYRHFVRGFLDGDGCIYTNQGSPSLIITGQENFLSELQEVFQKYCSATWFISEGKSFEIRTSKFESVKKCIHWLYDGATIFLKRKREKAIEALKQCNDKLVPSINYGTTNLFSYKGNKLRNNYIRSLSSEEKEEAALEVLNKLKLFGFPFPKYLSKDLEDDFEKLMDVNLSFKDKNINTNTLCGSKISNHYFPQFYNVKTIERPSMVEAFHNDNLLLKTIRNRLGITHNEVFNITGSMIRQGLRNSYSAFAASTFKPSIAKLIYKTFAPKRSITLDISAGFGHRLLGAFASAKINKYIGVDPWKANIDSCNEVKKRFDFNAEFHCIGSENFCPEELVEQIDFCFSSPPFYNKEVYNDEDSQAYNNTSKREFINVWWLKTAENVHKLLKPNSLFVVNMDSNIFDHMMAKCEHLFSLQDTYFVSNKRGHMDSDSKDSFFILKKI